MKITEGKKSGKRYKCNTQKNGRYLYLHTEKKKKKEKQLPTKPKRWKILGRFMKSLEIKE